MEFQSGLEFAKHLDAIDELSEFRSQFHLPTDPSGNPLIYFCGNSLGLQPKITKSYNSSVGYNCGDYLMTPSIDGALKSGRLVAEKVLDKLST